MLTAFVWVRFKGLPKNTNIILGSYRSLGVVFIHSCLERLSASVQPLTAELRVSTMGYQNILIAIELTEESDEVMKVGKALATAFSSSATVVSVVQPLSGAYGGLDMANMAAVASFEQDAVGQARKQLKALAQEFEIDPDQTLVLVGSPAAEIRRKAQQEGHDLIVIGTHGRHGLGLLLGSTANAVLHGVTCDVMAVKIKPDS